MRPPRARGPIATFGQYDLLEQIETAKTARKPFPNQHVLLPATLAINAPSISYLSLLRRLQSLRVLQPVQNNTDANGDGNKSDQHGLNTGEFFTEHLYMSVSERVEVQ